MIISKCPICGKYPKIVPSKYYPTVEIYCKPLFQTAHLKVLDRSTYSAMEEWNKACELLREKIKEHDI